MSSSRGTTVEKPLTTRQRTLLLSLRHGGEESRQRLGVRVDVLWRLEERGLVTRGRGDEWTITRKGLDALD